MRRYWFSADIHIDHTNCIHLTGRPFNNVQEMEALIVENINKKVKPDDVLFLVGDVCLGKKASWVRFLSALDCKNIILIIGNHDKWACIPKDMVIAVLEVARLRMYGKTFLVSHYPYRCSPWRAFWKRLHPSVCSIKRPKDTGLWLLHGHTHQKDRLCDYHPRQLNVGVDANGFAPISGEEIISIIQRKENKY